MRVVAIDLGLHSLFVWIFLSFGKEIPKQSSICTQPVEIRPCQNTASRWYYNATTSQCETFEGCSSSKNNFRTEEECKSKCTNGTPLSTVFQTLKGKNNIKQSQVLKEKGNLMSGSSNSRPIDSKNGQSQEPKEEGNPTSGSSSSRPIDSKNGLSQERNDEGNRTSGSSNSRPIDSKNGQSQEPKQEGNPISKSSSNSRPIDSKNGQSQQMKEEENISLQPGTGGHVDSVNQQDQVPNEEKNHQQEFRKGDRDDELEEEQNTRGYQRGQEDLEDRLGLSPQDFTKDSINRGSDPYEHTSSHFAAYFLTSIVMVFAAYAAYHNRQKIIAIIIEGKSDEGSRRRGYRKLETNVEEAMPSLQNANSTYVY